MKLFSLGLGRLKRLFPKSFGKNHRFFHTSLHLNLRLSTEKCFANMLKSATLKGLSDQIEVFSKVAGYDRIIRKKWHTKKNHFIYKLIFITKFRFWPTSPLSGSVRFRKSTFLVFIFYLDEASSMHHLCLKNQFCIISFSTQVFILFWRLVIKNGQVNGYIYKAK